jgi:hypothetical protein
VTTIGFSDIGNKFKIFNGFTENMVNFEGSTPGHAFLLPMLKYMKKFPKKNKKWQVIFISDGEFDANEEFFDTLHSLPSRFPQFLPVFISCGNQAAICQLMQAMTPFSYGKSHFLMHDTQKLFDVLAEFNKQKLTKRTKEYDLSPLLDPKNEIINSNFPKWPDCVNKKNDFQLVVECIKCLSLSDDTDESANDRLAMITDSLLMMTPNKNRNTLLSLSQKNFKIDTTNSEVVVNSMNEVAVFDDGDEFCENTHTEAYYTWRRYNEDLCYRIIGYEDVGCTKLVPSFWVSNYIAFEINIPRIYYTIEVMTNKKKRVPIVLSIRDEYKKLTQYLLKLGRGVVDGGEGHRLVFEIKWGDFKNRKEVAMPDFGLEFRIDCQKDLLISQNSSDEEDSYSDDSSDDGYRENINHRYPSEDNLYSSYNIAQKVYYFHKKYLIPNPSRLCISAMVQFYVRSWPELRTRLTSELVRYRRQDLIDAIDDYSSKKGGYFSTDSSDSDHDNRSGYINDQKEEVVRARHYNRPIAYSEINFDETRRIPACATTDVGGGVFAIGKVQLNIKNLTDDFTMIKAYIYPIDNFITFLVSEIKIDTTKLFVQTHCIICMVEPPTWLYAPCNHLIFCEADKNAYYKSPNSVEICPMCRASGTLEPASGTVIQTIQTLQI